MVDDRSAITALQTVCWIKFHAIVFGCEKKSNLECRIRMICDCIEYFTYSCHS